MISPLEAELRRLRLPVSELARMSGMNVADAQAALSAPEIPDAILAALGRNTHSNPRQVAEEQRKWAERQAGRP